MDGGGGEEGRGQVAAPRRLINDGRRPFPVPRFDADRWAADAADAGDADDDAGHKGADL